MISLYQSSPRTLFVLLICAVLCAGANAGPVYVKKESWAETMLASRDALARSGSGSAQEILTGLEIDFPTEWDWFLQDAGPDTARWFESEATGAVTHSMENRVLGELGTTGTAIARELSELATRNAPPEDLRRLQLYESACRLRRELRLKPLTEHSRSIVFTKHCNLGGSHYAYTEGQSDAQAECHFIPGSSLCVLTLDGTSLQIRTLLEDKTGMIRDPAVSYDGKRILFAWKKSLHEDDFHLYVMETSGGSPRQITFGLGFADYEGSWLPNGDIVFNSTRCVQTVDCWWTEVSNLHTCDKDGRFLRRLTFDQVHDNYPTVLDDGRVVYTRWEYNDRGQVYPQPLFQMNPDGTGQSAFYGGNSWFPTSILHARGIPGTQKVMAVGSGHHTMQAGKLIVIDPAKGREEAAGVQLIAPARETSAVRIDAYGQEGELFQNPYPLSEEAFLVGYHPTGWRENRHREPHFKLYFMHADGRRELLAADAALSCSQPVLMEPRPVPSERSSMVDYRENNGTYSMQNVYAGRALEGIEKGTVVKLRVVTFDFRAAGIGHNSSGGPAGGALSSTPPSINNGSWDPKIVLGEATVYDDGSAFFQAPARVPLYFQAIDGKGRVVQTMRSWSTLQPGENAACIGCHEAPNAAALALRKPTKAALSGAQPLKPFYGPARPFLFAAEIQPILNKHCVSCHQDRSGVDRLLAMNKKSHEKLPAAGIPQKPGAFSLLGIPNLEPVAQREWSDSYLYLTNGGKPGPLVNWIGAQSVPTLLPPRFAGAATSKLMDLLENGHRGVKLSREELDKIACWIDLLVPFCGDYREAAAWSPGKYAFYDRYLLKRRREQESQHAAVESLIAARNGPQPAVRIRLVDAAGCAAAPGRAFQAGDRIQVSGPPHLVIRFGPRLPETVVYSPEGQVEFPVPFAAEAKAYAPDAFSGTTPVISARPATPQELAGYRNVALNPYDPRGLSSFFPHATSNSECRSEPVFAARNAIDGAVENRRHGAWPNQSWGPDQRTDLWWRVDFGRPVAVDKLVLFVRADFPHDVTWSRATVRFSDGSTEQITIGKTSEPQTFAFSKRTTDWVLLTGLIQDGPQGWCAISEVQAFGNDLPGEKGPSK